jgi:hypothetical protein
LPDALLMALYIGHVIERCLYQIMMAVLGRLLDAGTMA